MNFACNTIQFQDQHYAYDRCRPCPYVEQAAKDWNSNHGKNVSNRVNPNLKVGYKFIPCDGSVFQNFDDEDMGCMDHKNRHGQLEVAKFLMSKIKDEIRILLNIWKNVMNTTIPHKVYQNIYEH